MKSLNLKKKRFISLKYRLMVTTSILLLLLLTTLTFVLVDHQTKTIYNRIEKQGLIISNNLVAISVEHLITYNYIAMEKLVNQVINDLDIVEVIIYDKEGKVAGYSGRPDLQNKILTDDLTITALKAKQALVRVLERNKPQLMDIAVPVYLPETKDRWGTIRVGLSLEQLHQQTRQTRLSIFITGFVFLVIGILFSNMVARRITKPLEKLTQGTIEAAKGNLDQVLTIHTRDEIEILAANFSSMIQEVLLQKQLLEHQLNEIQQLQQYSEKILATMNDGLLTIDMRGIIITANSAAHDILDIPANKIVKNYLVFDLIENAIPLATYIQDILNNPLNLKQQEIHLKKGEETQVLLASSSILQSDNKIPKQIIFNITDITDLKNLEEKIHRNKRLADLGVLAAGMSHEIRNPLSAIKTFVALLPKKIEKPGFLEKFQRTVPREINRLNNLVEDLLELSRKQKPNFAETDMGYLLKQCIELMEIDLSTKGIKCHYNIPKVLPKISADGDQLQKVFINLIQNSAQAMPDGGVITIDVSSEDIMLTLNFQDTGLGMTPDVSEKLFNPFYTTKIKGTGLGLAISHKIISDHNGQIEVKSSEGAGSCFSIHLPKDRLKN